MYMYIHVLVISAYMLNANWNSVKQRAMAWSHGLESFSISWLLTCTCITLMYTCARVTARDSIGHVEKGLIAKTSGVMFIVAQLVESLSFMMAGSIPYLVTSYF